MLQCGKTQSLALSQKKNTHRVGRGSVKNVIKNLHYTYWIIDMYNLNTTPPSKSNFFLDSPNG